MSAGGGRARAGAQAPRSDATACRRVLARRSRSFALASRLLPAERRDRAAALYAWCRYADDAVDRARGADQARAVARLRRELAGVYQGEAQAPLALAALQEVVRACRIPREYPDALVAGMEMDASGTRYDSMDTLLVYCYRVAGVVGLMMSHVMQLERDEALVHAAHMGMAMQLTNICRDVLEDWDMGRLYVPDDVLATCGLAGLGGELGRPFPASAAPGMARAVGCLLAEADRYYASGDRGLAALPWRCALAVRAARLVYSAIGERLRVRGCDVTAGRAVVTDAGKLALVARAAVLGAAEAPGRRLMSTRHSIPSRIIRYPDHVFRL